MALGYRRDHVRTPQPMRLGEVCRRPLRRMVGMRVIEPGNLQTLVARAALDANQLKGSNMVAVVRGIRPRIPGPYRLQHAPPLRLGPPQQRAAALVRIGFFPMSTERIVNR